MREKRTRQWWTWILCGIALAASPGGAAAERLRLEVAENGGRFSFDEEPVFADGLPAYGNAFVTEGYLYPPGTLTCEEGGCNGVLADGSPEFPDLVLGTWTCWGTHVGDGAHTESGPWVVSKQVYSLGGVPGVRTLVTSGFELADIDVAVQRAIVGGTGAHHKARGAQQQTFLGFNASAGVVLRVDMRIRK
jgi:hypothetical protein